MTRTILISALLTLAPISAYAGCAGNHEKHVKISCPSGTVMTEAGTCVTGSKG